MAPGTKVTIANIEMTFYCYDSDGVMRFYFERDGITIYYRNPELTEDNVIKVCAK